MWGCNLRQSDFNEKPSLQLPVRSSYGEMLVCIHITIHLEDVESSTGKGFLTLRFLLLILFRILEYSSVALLSYFTIASITWSYNNKFICLFIPPNYKCLGLDYVFSSSTGQNTQVFLTEHFKT